jgi:hypothetical protein
MRLIGNGRYALARELGRGGMGVVWLAEDRVLGREVAVKELSVPAEVPEQQRSVYRERVVREARTASRLREPAVVTVYDLLTEDGRTYIVMEYVDAPTLADLVGRDGPMSTERAARLGVELLAALEAAHAAGIVHRDVKPGNVMVPAKGTVKLTDFGIAQSFTDPRLTSTGALIGTPSYMSPERLSGGEPSAAWDLWALGATLFFAVEGYDAFGRDTVTATMLAVMTERAELTRCRGPLAEVISGLLEPDPARRLTAAEVRPLLDRALGSGGRVGPKPTTPLVDPAGPKPTAQFVDPSGEQVGPKPTASYAPDPFAGHPHAERVRAQQAQAMARYVSLRRLTRIALVAVPIIIVAAFVPVIMTAISTMNTLNQPVLTPGSTTGVALDPLPATRTSTPAVIAVMQPIMTYGAGGDITSDKVPFRGDSCYAWTPVKGKPAPHDYDYVDCTTPHGVQAFDFGIITPEIDAPYPTPAQLTQRATALCTKQFLSSRITVADKERSLRYWVLVPTPAAWNPPLAGSLVPQRTYWCVAGRADGADLTDSIE